MRALLKGFFGWGGGVLVCWSRRAKLLQDYRRIKEAGMHTAGGSGPQRLRLSLFSAAKLLFPLSTSPCLNLQDPCTYTVCTLALR